MRFIFFLLFFAFSSACVRFVGFALAHVFFLFILFCLSFLLRHYIFFYLFSFVLSFGIWFALVHFVLFIWFFAFYSCWSFFYFVLSFLYMILRARTLYVFMFFLSFFFALFFFFFLFFCAHSASLLFCRWKHHFFKDDFLCDDNEFKILAKHFMQKTTREYPGKKTRPHYDAWTC